MKRLIFWTVFLGLLLLVGCEAATDDMGVVARVNGRPIPLSQLEFQHDLLHMDGAGTVVPSVEALREEYGNILADLIVLELVEQNLEEKGLSVTDEEMTEEEAKVRADYPENAFEQVLTEEYIDLSSWRRQLRYDTSRRKFFQSVLRPRVKVDYLEADSYYKEHIKDFVLPESYQLVVMRGSQKGHVEKAVATYREIRDLATVRADATAASINELKVSAVQISEEWKKALDKLPEGEVSPVLQTRGGFEALMLERKIPATALGPTQAYPLVEQAILEIKLSEAFEVWLASQLQKADIQISALLLDGQAEETKAELDSKSLQGEPVEEELNVGETPLDDESANGVDDTVTPATEQEQQPQENQ